MVGYDFLANLSTITLPQNGTYSHNPYYYNLNGRKFGDAIDFSNIENFNVRYVQLDRQPACGYRQLKCFHLCQFDYFMIPSIKDYGALVLESTEQPDKFKRLGWARLVSADFEGSEECEIKLI
jgi:hypothetical protein